VNIKKLFNYKFCVPIYENLNEYISDELNYGNLLKHSININDIKNYDKNDINFLNNICKEGYKPCGILDTMNNILCMPKKYNCPLNDIIVSRDKNLTLIDSGYNEITLNNSFFIYLNTKENIERPIIITKFISFEKPWNHEYQNFINSVFSYEKAEIFDDYDIYMKIVPFLNFSSITLDDILNWEEENDYLKSLLNEAKPSKNYFLFHKNYIGFKNYEELLKFKKIFKEDNYKKGLQFEKYIPHSLGAILNYFPLIGIIIIEICEFCVLLKDGPSKVFSLILIILFGVFHLIYFIIYFTLYSLHKIKMKRIQFTLDAQMQSILNSFYKDNKQKLYDIAIYLISISIVPIFILLIIEYTKVIKKYCRFCGIC
jgi:hypothetical protein